ncbi:hypothetical protein Tco_1531562 [Tanacetum coccineum]
MGYIALTARDLDTMPGNAGSQSGLKTTRITRKGGRDEVGGRGVGGGGGGKQAEQGVPLQAEQADWLEDTDEEIDEHELEAHYNYMAKIQEVSPEESSSTGQPLEQTGIVSLIALQTKQTELEKYTALNDRTSDYKILQTKLNETLGLLALKDIDIQEGQLKEETKDFSELKVKEGRDNDTMD